MSSKNNFITITLRGTSQVFFMENTWTGLLFFAAMGYASYVTGVWATTIGALIGVGVATLTALILNCDEDSTTSGLFGFNGVLVGAALPTFVAVSPSLWFYVVVGAALSTVVTAAFSATLTKTWNIPGSTGPFVLTAWLLVGGSYLFGDLTITSLAPKLSTDYLSGVTKIPSPYELILIFFKNIGQVYLLGSAVSGAIILIGIFLASVRAGIAAVGGSVIAMIVAIGMGANPAVVSEGLYGFSPVLTAMAVGVIFLKPSFRVALYAVLAVIVTVFIQGAMDIFMAVDGLPSFTAPYVLAMYLFIAPDKLSAPHPHKIVKSDHLLSK